jgi:CPW-WPC domain-containing protein
MKLFCVLACIFLTGCGPNLTRPGYKPPPDKPAIELFQDAQKDLLNQLRFNFLHTDFAVLNGVANDVHQVITKYPPMTTNPQVLNLHISGLIEQIFLEFLSSKGFETRDMECVRDYSELCPERWTDTGDGVTCEGPPELYEQADCRTVQFGQLTPLEKSQKAFECGKSTYPCRNTCPQDYSKLCPVGWAQFKRTSVCVAPPTYVKPCVSAYDFTDHNWTQKRKFSEICKVNWPCINP